MYNLFYLLDNYMKHRASTALRPRFLGGIGPVSRGRSPDPNRAVSAADVESDGKSSSAELRRMKEFGVMHEMDV